MSHQRQHNNLSPYIVKPTEYSNQYKHPINSSPAFSFIIIHFPFCYVSQKYIKSSLFYSYFNASLLSFSFCLLIDDSLFILSESPDFIICSLDSLEFFMYFIRIRYTKGLNAIFFINSMSLDKRLSLIFISSFFLKVLEDITSFSTMSPNRLLYFYQKASSLKIGWQSIGLIRGIFVLLNIASFPEWLGWLERQ
jgi:hypothetical protein